ncbi:hypothetical protein J6590_060999 [Homalodisca vitripennis]|nr:hypothetical protein J6590_060999 [Homalodisca vitripennis]
MGKSATSQHSESRLARRLVHRITEGLARKNNMERKDRQEMETLKGRIGKKGDHVKEGLPRKGIMGRKDWQERERGKVDWKRRETWIERIARKGNMERKDWQERETWKEGLARKGNIESKDCKKGKHGKKGMARKGNMGRKNWQERETWKGRIGKKYRSVSNLKLSHVLRYKSTNWVEQLFYGQKRSRKGPQILSSKLRHFHFS